MRQRRIGLSLGAILMGSMASCAHSDHRATVIGPVRERPAIISDTTDSADSRLIETAAYIEHDHEPATAQAPSASELPPTPDGAEPEPAISRNVLTLAELENLALANNPTLGQAQASVNARAGTRLQAGLYPNPRIGYQGSEIGNNGKGGQQGAYIAQEFVTADKLRLQQHAETHAMQAAQFQQIAQEYRVLTSVRIGFYDVLAAQETIKLAEELVKIGERGVQTAEALINAGQSTRVDLLQVNVELNTARIALQKSHNRHQAALSRLSAVVGVSSLPSNEVAGSLEATPENLDSDEIYQRIVSSSPEVAAAQQNVYRAQAALRRAEVEPIPNIDVQTGAQYDFSTNTTVANLIVELPIPIHNRNQGNILKAQSALVHAGREFERIELDLRNRLAAAVERYSNASAEIVRYKSSILPDAKESLKLLSDAYQAEGKIDFVRLLIAQRTNFQTQIEYLNALRDWWAAKQEIDGLLLSNGLERAGDIQP